MINDIVPGSPSSDLLLNKNKNKIRKTNHKLRRKLKNKRNKITNSVSENDLSLLISNEIEQIRDLEQDKFNDINNAGHVFADNSESVVNCYKFQNDCNELDNCTFVSTMLTPESRNRSARKKKFSDEESFGVTDTEMFQIGEAADAVMDAHDQNISFVNKSNDQATNSRTTLMEILNDFNDSHEDIRSPSPVVFKSQFVKTYSRSDSVKIYPSKLSYSPSNSSESNSIALSDHDFQHDRTLSDYDTDFCETVFNANEESFIDMNETSKIGENLSQLSFLLSNSPEEQKFDKKINVKNDKKPINLNLSFLYDNDSSEPFKGFENVEVCDNNIIDIDIAHKSCEHTLVQRFDTIKNNYEINYPPNLEIDLDNKESESEFIKDSENNKPQLEEQLHCEHILSASISVKIPNDNYNTPELVETAPDKNIFNFSVPNIKLATSVKVLEVLPEITADSEHTILLNCNHVKVKTDEIIPSVGFSAASGKKLEISEEALQAAQKMFIDCNNEEPITNVNVASVGFSAASGKKLAISEEALKAAQKMFSDCNNEEPVTNVNVASIGFSAASGKKLEISEKALQAAQKMFSDCNNEEPVTNVNVASVGFSAASGKKLAISEEALKAAQKMFSDCNNEEPVTNVNVASVGFSAASGKKLAISEEALKAAQKMFSDCNNEEPVTNVNVASVGFSAASGKKLAISEEALKAAQKMFSDCNNEEPVTNVNVASVGFSAASGKKLAISEEALKAAQKMFSDCNNEEPVTNVNVASIGFSAASGKKLEISEKALQAAQKMFSDCNNEEPVTNVNVASVGFSAASGKKLAISEEALKAAQKMFSDCNNEEPVTNVNVASIRFSAASGKKLAISEEALKAAQKMFSDCNNEEPVTNVNVASVGFSAASGKKLSISEEALKAAQKMFSDCNNEEPVTNVNVASVGFSAASGKNLAISEKALQAAQKMFSDCNNEEPVTNVNVASVGFSAASGKKLAISEEALKAAQKMFSDCNNEEPVTNVNVASVGFSAASGKKLAISEEALKAAQKMFSDCNNEEPGIKVRFNANVDCNSLSISDEALKTAQKMFDEIDNDDFFLCDIPNTCPTNTVLEPIESRIDSVNTILFNEISNSPINTSNINKSKSLINMSFTSTPKVATLIDKMSTPQNNTVNVSLSQEISASTHALLEDEFLSPYSNWKQLPISPVSGIPPKKKKQQCLFTKFNTVSTDSDCDLTRKRVNSNVMVPDAKKQKSIFYSCIENISTLIKDERLNAEIDQCEFIKNKSNELKRPLPGIVFQNKNLPNRQTLINFVEHTIPMNYSIDELINLGLSKNTISTTVENALDFKFDLFDYYNAEICNNNTKGVTLYDGYILVMDENSSAGIKQMKNCFLAAPGVDPTIVPEGWIENSYKWIVSKLASMERSFPKYFSARALTPQNLILQMKYRYDLEIDNTKRSVLRKIIERDDVSCKRMVLFVSKINKILLDYIVELSDGWYSINADIDAPLMSCIRSGKIKVGTKLVIQGAELLNNEQGCSPLEMSDAVKLKIFANSTRRVRWDTKLGYCKNLSNLPISLNSILDKGGLIGSVTVFILRIYPMMYLEKTKGVKGSILRSEKVEKRLNAANESINSKNIELIYSQAKKEIADKYNNMKREKKKLLKQKISDITEASQLYNLLESSNDPETIEQDMSASQKELVRSYQSEILANRVSECEELVQERLKPVNQKRSVCPLLKMRIVDANSPRNTMILSIWRPDENILKILKENNAVTLLNISASGSHCNEIQLSAGKRTIYKIVDKTKFTTPSNMFRMITPVSDIVKINFSPNFNEFDTVGIVVFISEADSKQFQSVYIADGNFNILCINFWAGVKEYAYDDIVRCKSILGISNLKWRPNMATIAFATEFTKITDKTKSDQFGKVMDELIFSLTDKDLEKYILECNDKIDELKTRKLNKINAFDIKENIDTTPLKGSKLGNASTPKNVTSLSRSIMETPKEFSPGVGHPTMKIQNRIELLQKYGEPPELSPLVAKSTNSLKRKYSVPRRI